MNALDELYQKLRRRPRDDRAVQSPPQEVEDHEVDDDAEDGDSADRMDVEEMEVDPALTQGPIIDEDGFELVQPKGRRRGR